MPSNVFDYQLQQLPMHNLTTAIQSIQKPYRFDILDTNYQLIVKVTRCNTESFEYGGITYVGKLFNRSNYPKHLEKSLSQQQNQPEPSLASGSRAPDVQQPFSQADQQTQSRKRKHSDSPAPQDHNKTSDINLRPQKHPRTTSESTMVLTSNEIQIQPSTLVTFFTKTFKVPLTFLQHRYCLQSMFHVLHDHFNEHKSVRGSRTSLKMEKSKVQNALAGHPLASKILNEIPLTLDKLVKTFRLKILQEKLILKGVYTNFTQPDNSGIQFSDPIQVPQPSAGISEMDLDQPEPPDELSEKSSNCTHYTRSAKTKSVTECSIEVSQDSVSSKSSNATVHAPEGVVGKTLINSHTQHALFKHLLMNTSQEYQASIGVEALSHSTSTKWKPVSPSDEVLTELQVAVAGRTDFTISETSKFESTVQWEHGGKNFTRFSKHKGNSYVQFETGGRVNFGTIDEIFRVVGNKSPFFLVKPFTVLQGLDESRNPFRSLPYLKATVMYHSYQKVQCVLVDKMFGHVAVRVNPPNTFNISHATVSIVALRSMFQKYLKTSLL
ncbi:uncharacterized protein MELLADRAFT_107078 [Melampsora larici-populina 98AG31]|uniref:Uncharacterized protein n=1 Tax=Melampsora larici-populina (strain 98AG31 / pathotype 3-4-7) TaxID=747676 RepID=F4RNL0_MELLP|nr:uncharacterized protein MELLADRAFT_107078 [Melampsora larici-populina 98AG31]EGG06076.1 hypothetical protein MELLADRAFT_107078 [Melampsora larici-populina 98AG31]